MIYRSDNRACDQLRPVNIIPNYISTAEGSCLIEVGNTRVVCTATIEDTVPQFLRNSGKGWVTAEYGMLPRATLTRSPREVTKGRAGGRTHEIQRLIGRSLRAVTDTEKLGERTVFIDCDVIQADGGTRTASITGAFVALGLAIKAMLESGALKASPITRLRGRYQRRHRRWSRHARPLLRRRLPRRRRHEHGRHRQQKTGRSAGNSRTPPLR